MILGRNRVSEVLDSDSDENPAIPSELGPSTRDSMPLGLFVVIGGRPKPMSILV